MPDSLLQELHILSSKIDKLSKANPASYAAPILAAFIGAIIAIVAQWIDRFRRNQRENKKDLRELQSTCVNAKIRLQDLFRQLAMHKFHAQYWWHLHSKEGDTPFYMKYYVEHLRSQSDAREVERLIGDVKADFLAQVVKFERTKGKGFNVDSEKTVIEKIVFRKTKTYSDDVSTDELRNELAEKDERELRDDYFTHLQVFQTIIDKMKNSA